MEAHVLHKRLVAVLCGLAVAALVVVATCVLLPRQDVHQEGIDCGYVYSGAKSSSVDFVRASLSDQTPLVLGSSEFSTPARTVPQVPAQTFGTNVYGIRPMLVGEAFDQCLWHTMALGALADGGLPRDKVVLIIGLGQYTDGGLDASSFATRFSYTMYQAFCANPDVSAELRAQVQKRLAEQGIDQTTLRAGAPEGPLDAINGAVMGTIDDLKLRSELSSVRAKGIAYDTDPVEDPDWDELRAEALEDARTMSTNNSWGVEDEFYAQQLGPALDSLKGARADETYTNTPEYDDLDLFLSVADACGVKPLIIIEPVLGPYYDHIGITKDTREAAYQRIRDIVDSHRSAQLADFSDREYERYFLYDIVHFGWTGWIDAEQAIFDFWNEEG